MFKKESNGYQLIENSYMIPTYKVDNCLGKPFPKKVSPLAHRLKERVKKPTRAGGIDPGLKGNNTIVNDIAARK